MRTLASGSWANRSFGGRSKMRSPVVRFPRAEFRHFDALPEGFLLLSQISGDQALAPEPEKLGHARAELVSERRVTGLARLRLLRGMSQLDLANAVGTSQPRLSTWEKGTEKPGFENLKKLRAILDVSYDELIEAFL